MVVSSQLHDNCGCAGCPDPFFALEQCDWHFHEPIIELESIERRKYLCATGFSFYRFSSGLACGRSEQYRDNDV